MSESTTVAEQVDNATYLKNIIDYMQSTFVDRDYSIENDWKIIFKHSYMYPNQYPGYTQKKNELLIKKHSTEEILGFQLLPHKFQSMSFLPMLNQHVMSEFRQAQLQNSILKEVVPNQEGITLFKSVDVLLKSVAHSHRRYAKIAVYKVMPGRTKVRFCTDEELNNKINDLPLEHEFDSSSMEYMGGKPLKTNSLVNQLLCSQITLQDVREHSVNGRTIEMLEDAPRQISPVTVVTFVY
uniref:Uncharacterized protein n=1 Tax=Ciona savignyi TaxID=51511 RepID=H2YWD5_CIOSA